MNTEGAAHEKSRGATLRQVYDLLMESQYWSHEQLAAYQRSQLEQLLRHAHQNVPFYRSRLDRMFSASGEVLWGRWHDLPVLKRSELEQHQAEMRAASVPERHGAAFEETTSGTTTRPVTVAHSSFEIQVIAANDLRFEHAHGLDPGKNRLRWFGNDMTRDTYPTGTNMGRWGAPWDARRVAGSAFRLNRGVPVEDVMSFVSAKDIAYFVARPESAQSLADAARRLNISHKLEKVLAFSATVTPGQRADCRQHMNAEIAALYSSKEGARIAFTCPEGSHYHVNAETILVEILRDDGSPARPGEIGRVVITPFLNTSQPLIRYEHGDLAIPSGPCSCGRTLPVIQEITGRLFHMFRFPDGRIVAPWVPHLERESLLGTRALQVAQTGPWSVEVRFVPGAMRSERAKLAFVELARKALHPRATITLVPMTALPLSPSGKFLEYVNEWNGEAQ